MIWETFPFRHIQRFYMHAVREMWRARFWRMRLEAPKLKEPRWLYEDLDKQAASASKTTDDEYEKQKEYFRARAAARQEGSASGK